MTDIENKDRRAVRLPAHFSGVDELDAAFAAVPLSVIGYGVIVYALRSGSPGIAWIGLALWGAALVAWSGKRYRCTISAEEIRVEKFVMFFIPTHRRGYLLDVRIDLYESWDSIRPEGVEIGDSGAFGPYFSPAAMEVLVEKMRRARDWARVVGPEARTEIRCQCLDGQEGHLQILDRRASGVVARAKAERPVRVGGVEIPAGSIFVFNGGATRDDEVEYYRDPRRADDLSWIECEGPVRLAHGLVVGPRAHLWVSSRFDRVTVKYGFEGEMEFSGIFVDGTERITFDEEGGLVGYTLSRPLIVDGMTIPAGSSVNHWRCPLFGYQAWVRLAQDTFREGRKYRKGDTIQFVPALRVAGIVNEIRDLRSLVYAPNG